MSDGITAKSDTLAFFVAPPTNVEPLPTGVEDGINYLANDSSVILVLFAPGKSRVAVIGDFNNWQQEAGYLMNKTPDGKYFWLQIDGLALSTEYKVNVNKNIVVTGLADIWTSRQNDFIVEIYPNLFGSNLTLFYLLPGAGQVSVRVVDISGRQLKLYSAGWKARGRQTISMREVLNGVGRIVPGIYSIQVVSGY